MATMRRETPVETPVGNPVEELLRDLQVHNPTETKVGNWNGPDGEVEVVFIHETGHVYLEPARAGGEPMLLFRLPVEALGVEGAIAVLEKQLSRHPEPETAFTGNTRKCATPGCMTLIPEDTGRSVAPGTYIAACDPCMVILAPPKGREEH